jgi:hypothetical protein
MQNFCTWPSHFNKRKFLRHMPVWTEIKSTQNSTGTGITDCRTLNLEKSSIFFQRGNASERKGSATLFHSLLSLQHKVIGLSPPFYAMLRYVVSVQFCYLWMASLQQWAYMIRQCVAWQLLSSSPPTTIKTTAGYTQQLQFITHF